MKSCWAACLGDCLGKTSREHLISRNLFDGETVKVCGFSWFKDEEKERVKNIIEETDEMLKDKSGEQNA